MDEAGNTYAVAKVGALNMAIEQLRDGLAVQQTAIADIYDTREYTEHERLARAREILREKYLAVSGDNKNEL